jgi:dTDP-4-dehydrorhamnose reductase
MTSMRWLITGASGQLGGYLLRQLESGPEPVVAWSGSRQGTCYGCQWQPVDLTNAYHLASAFKAARPTAVIHGAALASLAECWQQPARAQQINAQASALLAELASQARARLVLVSTDLVFDGERGGYREQDPPLPLSVYGRTKAAAERAVLAFPETAVARLSLLFGPSVVGRPYFFDQQVTSLRQRRPMRLFMDEWRTPLSLAAAARALVSLARSPFVGLLHLGGPERMSRLEMGQRLARYLGVDASTILASSRDSITAAEPRPRDVSLDSSHWRELFPQEPWPDWEEALKEMGL